MIAPNEKSNDHQSFTFHEGGTNIQNGAAISSENHEHLCEILFQFHILQDQYKPSLPVGAKFKIRGSPKSLSFILWDHK